MGVRHEGKRAFAPLEIWSKNPKHLQNLKTAVQFRLISLILAIAVYLPVWHTAQEGRSLFWCYEVLSSSLLMFATSPADAGCKACERIVRSLLFIA